MQMRMFSNKMPTFPAVKRTEGYALSNQHCAKGDLNRDKLSLCAFHGQHCVIRAPCKNEMA